MTRKSASGAARGLYCGLTLAEWRGSIEVLRTSRWSVFGTLRGTGAIASDLHGAVVQASCLLLPLQWHRDHAGRLDSEWYRQRRARVNARGYALSQLRERGDHAT